MTEDDRRDLYTTLLRGIANECQDRLCAADTQHAWGPWRQFQVRHDNVPLRFDPSPMVSCKVIHVRSERHCENCGKEQIA